MVTDRAGRSQPARLSSVGPAAASFVVPTDLALGPATLKVFHGRAMMLAGSFTVATASPGLYSANGNSAGVAAATAERMGPNGPVVLPVFNCQANVPLSCLSTPLDLSPSSEPVYLTLSGTGIRGASSVQAFVAGQPVPVAGFGVQNMNNGLDQVKILLPATLAGSGEASVYVVADGTASNMVTVNIQ